MNIRIELSPSDLPDCETLAELGAHRDLVRDAVSEVFPTARVDVVVRMGTRRSRQPVSVWGVEDAHDVRATVDVLLGQVAS
jgi:hypothetical protein